MTSVPIPTSPKEVTKEWLRLCLQENLQDSKDVIEVLGLEQIKEKNGFMSGYFKAKVKINDQIQKLFIKTILDKEDPLRFMMDKIDFDRIEISTYKSFIPELIKYEKLYCDPERSQLEDLIPSIYAADYCLDKQNRGYYLIMEDISDKYSLIATEEGLSYLQVSKAVEKLARFHATGFAFVKNKPSVIESWKLSPIYPFIDDFKRGIDASIVEAITNEKPDFRKHIETIDKNWWEICQNAFFFKEKRFLTHADSWLNNIFFSFDDCKLLDWQALSLNHPVIDIAFLLGTCLTPEHLELWMEDLLDEYLNKFNSTCEEMKELSPFDLPEDFKTTFYTHGIMSMGFMFIFGWKDLTVLTGMKPRAINWIHLAIKNNPQYFEK